MKYWKKSISFLMAMAMVISMLPVPAFADGPEDGETEIIETSPEQTESIGEEEVPEEPEEEIPVESILEEDAEEIMDAAITGSCGYDMTWKLDGGVLTISGTGDMADYSSRTGAPWKEYRSTITSVIVKDGVEGLGRNAFNGCKNLASVSLPETLLDISDSVFEGCAALKRVTIPESVTNIDNYVFKDCVGLTSVTIPSAVATIGSAPFLGCTGLTAIAVGSQNENYKAIDGIVYNKAGTELLIYPAGRSGSFAIPKGVTRIGSSAFEGCSSLSGVTIPTTVTYIADSAFESCIRLTDVVIPGSVKDIYYNAFSTCTNLQTVTFEGSAPEIWTNAFYSCTLTAFYNGKDSSWKNVAGQDYGGKIFWIDSSDVNAPITESAPCGPKATWVINRKGVLTISGTGDMNDFASGRPWDDYYTSIREVVIESGITSVGAYAFTGYNITRVTLPDTLTRIGEAAFNSCGYLTSAALPAKLKTIDSYAFLNCVSLTTMTIPAGVTAIGDSVFTGCIGLRSFTVASGSTAFSANSGMLLSKDGTRLVSCPSGKTGSCAVPDGVKTIAAGAFGSCIELTAVTLPQGLTTIGAEAFRECGIVSLKIPDSVTSIEMRAFANCDGLKTMTFEGNAPKLGDYIFLNDTLTVTYPGGSGWNTAANQNYGGNITWVTNAAPTTYTIHYDANGGTGAPADQTKQKGTALTLSTKVPTRTGCVFLGWASSASAETAQYAAGSKYTRDADATLYAVWKATEYTITYVLNGGTNAASNPSSYTVLSGRITLADPTRAGYRFQGWYLEAEQRTKITAIASGTTGNLTLYAGWASNTCTVTYNANGGTGAPKAQSGAYGNTIQLASAVPAREGYLFLGWALSAQAEVPQYMPGSDYRLAGDVTFYAVWDICTFTVTYDANGGTGAPAAQQGTYGTTIKISSAVPKREGYQFLGWADTAQAAAARYQPGASLRLTEDVALYAVWKASEYTITYVLNGGTNAASNPASYTVLSGKITLAAPTRTGYRFLGWFRESGFRTQVTAIEAGSTGNLTLYANWTADSYTVTYDANGGTGAPAAQQGTYGTTIKLSSAAPKREGYQFLGWAATAQAAAAQYQPGASLRLTEDVTLYAVWKAREYTITYVLNGGTNAASNPDSYTVLSGKITLAAPTRTGYTFQGWYLEQDLRTKVTAIPAGSTGDVTFYASWVGIPCTLTYNANGGTGAPAAQQGRYGDTLRLSDAVPQRTGYTFLGWADAPGAVQAQHQPGSSWQLSGSMTLYAVWKLDTYSITYVLNGGTNAAANPDSYTILSGKITLADPSRVGARFLGWYLEPEFRTKITAIPAGSTGDVTLYASWVSSTCIVSYDANGGTGAPASQTGTYGETITVSDQVPQRSGFIFLGWALSPDAGKPQYRSGDSLSLTGDVTLFAVWEEFAYIVTFDANGGEYAPAAQRKIPGVKLAITEEKPVRYGYTFQGWAITQKSTTVKYKPGALYSADKDITLYAVWKVSVYSVKFDANGGKSAPAAMKKTHDKPITLPKKLPALVGYTCVGWADSPAAAEPRYLPGTAYTAEGDAVLYAVWRPTAYTITYVLKDGVPLEENPASYNIESEELALHAAAKEGFTFEGWFRDSGFKKPISSIPTGTTGNLKLYAKWTEHTYSIHFDGNGAESGKMTDLTGKKFSAKFALKANAFKRTGYEFDGWNTAPDGSGTAYADKKSVSGLSAQNGSVVTLYAQWKLKTFTVTFKPNKGQGGPEPQTKTWGQSLILSQTEPTRPGYTFLGWGTSASAKKPAWQPGDAYNFEKNITLYAVWAKN